jgi:histidinol-phosphate aminotransferase
MKNIWDLANPQLRDLVVYEPGKPIEETARELNVDPAEIIKLASNENPLGPSPKALEAMKRQLETAHLYPDGNGYYLRGALAENLGFTRENIILGNGSNEIIEFLCHAFVKPGDEVVTSQYAFIAYKLEATLLGARTIEVSAPDFQQDVAAMVDAITPKTRLLFLANPNNPTGCLVPQRKIDSFISRVPEDVITVFDEAYFEFLDDPPDTIQYVRQRKNVVVVRTFSKIHGLAGLRVGYGIADCAVIDVLQKAREPFNVGSIAQAGALAALGDQRHQQRTKQVVDAGRAYLQEQFANMNLRFVPAVANFVMVNVGDGPDIFQKLLAKKVIVRPLKGYGLPEWVRISVGTMPENEKCVAALKEVLDSG